MQWLGEYLDLEAEADCGNCIWFACCVGRGLISRCHLSQLGKVSQYREV